MTGRRRGIGLHRTPWETARWFAISRLAMTLAALVVLVALAAVLILTRPWQGLGEECVGFVPVPVVVTEQPGGGRPGPSDAGGDTPRSEGR